MKMKVSNNIPAPRKPLWLWKGPFSYLAHHGHHRTGLWSTWNFNQLESQQMSLTSFYRYWQKTSDFLGQRQRTLPLMAQQVPWASCLCRCPWLPKSHRGDTKGPMWVLYTQQVCVTAEGPKLRKPQSHKVLLANPHICPEGDILYWQGRKSTLS